MTSRSFKPSSFSRTSRPSFTRSQSNSPPTPSKQDQQRGLSSTHSFEGSSVTSDSSPVTTPQPHHSHPETPRINRSRPIAIELPSRRSRTSVSTPTPPEPLSARGDLPGGYFPFHEDTVRSYKPHPFHLDAAKASRTLLSSEPESSFLHPHSRTRQAFAEPTMRSQSPTMGALTTSMPLGKYHPNNYKNKNESSTSSSPLLSPQPQHGRQESDIRKKLQQYQRDMVEQAAIAGRLQMVGVKPENPRLVPLGSPGPVTPMELEESAGYLMAGTGGAADAGSQQEMVGRMIRAEQERMEREGRGSPVAMAGGM